MKSCDVFRKGKKTLRLNKNKEFYYTNLKRCMFLNWIKAENKKEPREVMFIKLHGKDAREINRVVTEYVENTKILYRETNGEINMFQLGKVKHVAIDQFLRLLDPEVKLTLDSFPCSIKEQHWLQGAYRGGLQYGKPFNGVAHKYDYTSFYPSIMHSEHAFPYSEPRFLTLKEVPLDSPVIGIFRGHYTGDHRFFRSKGDYHTDCDIRMGESLGLKFIIADDDKDNAMIYDSQIAGTDIFGNYVDRFFPLKQRGIKVCKKLLNTLYGCLGERERQIRTLKATEVIDVTHMTIDDITIQENLSFHVELIDKERQIFKYPNFARFVPFITSYGRSILLETFIDNIDDIVQCHTDGFISTCPMDIIGYGSSSLGGLKHEYSGNVHVHHVNKVVLSV
jgi:hypothetical protein